MALPNIVGVPVRRIELECRTNGSDKTYKIIITEEVGVGFHVFTEYGPRGKVNNGGSVGVFANNVKAVAKALNIWQSKTRKGYQLVANEDLTMSSPLSTDAPVQATKIRHQPTISIGQLSSDSRNKLANLF